ncbi:MAG: multicopper oxidase domain-containing protein [Gammaproteobacteria bacterium]|nr:multicopper oxidase domain-containing protein [Gammaproteobacteria bacterium]
MKKNKRTDRDGWTRRTLMGASAATLGVAAVAKFSVLDAFAQSAPVTRYPLRIPPVVAPTSLSLACRTARVDLGGGNLSNVLAYNGLFPGPTLLARTGDTATIRLHNELNEETITHWHGMVVDSANDGGPQLAFGPGQFYDYAFPIIQRACLNFYHPHPHMLTGKQVNLGLAGGFIVRDAEEDALALPAGPYEVPLVIRDATRDNKGNLVYKPASSGFNGKFPLVNGTLNPRLSVDRGVYRFRVVIGSNARVFRLALSNGAPFTVIGNDGGLLAGPVNVSQIEVGPGERLDLLVNFAALASGGRAMLRCLNAGWDLLEFVGTGAAGYVYSVPGVLSTITSLANPVRTRTFSFDGMSRINGQRFEMNRIDFQVPHGEVERWRFTSNGNAPHPVHVHGASFQVLSRTGGRGPTIFPWERGWKDTVLLHDQESVDVLVRFDTYTGLYVLHCHQLEHEDMGMMSNFVVV